MEKNLKYKIIDLGSISFSTPSFDNPWSIFFVLTTIMVIPSLICLWMIKNKIKIGAK